MKDKKNILNKLDTFIKYPYSNFEICELTYGDLTYFLYKSHLDRKTLTIVIPTDWISHNKKSIWLKKYLLIDKEIKITKIEVSDSEKEKFVGTNEIKENYVNLNVIDLSIETRDDFKYLLYRESDFKQYDFLNKKYLDSKYEIFVQRGNNVSFTLKKIINRKIFKKYQTKKIGVVSPFTYGKSALINSLLSSNLLQEDILVKTAKITSITSSEDFWIFKENPKLVIEKYNDENNFKERLSYLTTLNEKESHRVKATIKNPCLKDITYIDTPGLFGRYAEHDDITEKMIADLDFVIYVLNPAQLGFEPYTNKILEWQRKYNKPCIFVMNKMDLVKTTEDRDKLKNEFNKTLSQQIKHQGIFYISAYSALKARLYKKGRINLMDLKKDPSIYVIEDEWVMNGRSFTHEHVEVLEKTSGILKLEKFINQI